MVTSNRNPTLGVHLLDTITRGMYSQPFHSIREYIQNAYDSIRKARRDGLLSDEEGQIRLRVDEQARTLSICDNGTGLSPEEAAVYLLDIGNSNKARSDEGSIQNAGFRGIGRMAGISYCKKLRFETSCGDGRKCVVEFDAHGINRLTRRGQEPATIIEAIERNSRIDEDRSADGDRHYLEVTLEGFAPDSQFLNQDFLGDYLAVNTPVAHDPQEWTFGEKIRSLAAAADSLSSLEHVQILICDGDDNVLRDVRRPFRDTFRTTNALHKNPRTVNVTGIEALPQNGTKGDGWWGWVAVHERQGALAKVSYAGLRVRMHNIAIGDVGMVRSLFRTPSLVRWCFGEIYITDLSLTPNAQRDNFEQSKAWDRIKERLREEAKLLEQAIRDESNQRNKSFNALSKGTENLIEKANQAIEDGFASQEEKQATIRRLEEWSEKIDTQAKQKKRTEGEKASLEEQRKQLEQVVNAVKAVRKTGTDDALAHLNKQARRAVRTVFEVLKSELNDKQFNAIQAKVHAALKPGKRNT